MCSTTCFLILSFLNILFAFAIKIDIERFFIFFIFFSVFVFILIFVLFSLFSLNFYLVFLLFIYLFFCFPCFSRIFIYFSFFFPRFLESSSFHMNMIMLLCKMCFVIHLFLDFCRAISSAK
jgi:hypothetical protein